MYYIIFYSLEDILGYNAEDLIGKSVYEYHHALDSDAIGTAYKCCKFLFFLFIILF